MPAATMLHGKSGPFRCFEGSGPSPVKTAYENAQNVLQLKVVDRQRTGSQATHKEVNNKCHHEHAVQKFTWFHGEGGYLLQDPDSSMFTLPKHDAA